MNNQPPSSRLLFPRDGFRCWPYATFNEETANYLTGGTIQPSRPADSTTGFQAATPQFGVQGAEFPRTFAVDTVSNYFLSHPNPGQTVQNYNSELPRALYGGNLHQNDLEGVTRSAESNRPDARGPVWSSPYWQRRLGPRLEGSMAITVKNAQEETARAPGSQKGQGGQRRQRRRRPLDRAERAPRGRKRNKVGRTKTETKSKARDAKGQQDKPGPTGANAEPLGVAAAVNGGSGTAADTPPGSTAGGADDGQAGRTDPFLGSSSNHDDFPSLDDSLLDFDLGD